MVGVVAPLDQERLPVAFTVSILEPQLFATVTVGATGNARFVSTISS
mgnify:CR=1 FL=1